MFIRTFSQTASTWRCFLKREPPLVEWILSMATLVPSVRKKYSQKLLREETQTNFIFTYNNRFKTLNREKLFLTGNKNHLKAISA